MPQNLPELQMVIVKKACRANASGLMPDNSIERKGYRSMARWEHRKSDCELTLKDAQGNIMPGRRVKMELKRHEFLFGCGVF